MGFKIGDVTGIGSVADFAKGALDFIQGFFPKKMSEAEEAQAVLALQGMIQSRDAARDQATVTVIQSEMAQGDNYTKRARPSVVYVGLIFIGIVHVVIPLVVNLLLAFKSPAANASPEAIQQFNQMITHLKANMSLSLPGEFWAAWGAVVSIWSIGRSAEKRGASGKLLSAITGAMDLKKMIQ